MKNNKRSEAGRRGAAVTNRKRLAAIKNKHLRTSRSVAQLRAGRNDWFQIDDAAGDTTDVHIYDEIGFWGVTASDFVEALTAVKTPQMNLFINSPGGSVFDGLAIYNNLVRHPARVTAVVDGLAASAASFIAMAGDEVHIARNGIMMIHDALGICIGNPSDMAEMQELLEMHSDNIADIYAQKTGVDAETMRDLMRAETWFNSAEAIEAGLADQIVNSRGEPDEDPEDSFDLSIFSYAGRSKAPDPDLAALFVLDAAIGSHSTSTSDEEWDAGRARRNYPNEKATLRYAHAWVDSDGDPDAKASYKFPHHYSKGGPAILNGVRNGLARLKNADVDNKDGIRAHLNKHLRDGGGEPDEEDRLYDLGWDLDDPRDVEAYLSEQDNEPPKLSAADLAAKMDLSALRGAFG